MPEKINAVPPQILLNEPHQWAVAKMGNVIAISRFSGKRVTWIKVTINDDMTCSIEASREKGPTTQLNLFETPAKDG